MPSSDPPPTDTPDQAAGRLLAGHRLAVVHGLPWPSVDEIFAATRANREHAREIADAILAALPALEPSPNPPCGDPAAARLLRFEALAREALHFVMRHPGCAQSGAPARYSAGYRRFVIELRKRYADLTASEFAETIVLPLGTLEDWLRGVRRAADASAARNLDEPRAAADDAMQA